MKNTGNAAPGGNPKTRRTFNPHRVHLQQRRNQRVCLVNIKRRPRPQFEYRCSFCGRSANVDGSRLYKNVFACPRHRRRWLIEISRPSRWKGATAKR